MKPAWLRSLYWSLARITVDLSVLCSNALTTRIMHATNRILISYEELDVIARSVVALRPCRFLIFGMGYDSRYWGSLNQGGETVFIEDSQEWSDRIKSHYPLATTYLVEYGTTGAQWHELLDTPNVFDLELPPQVAAEPWDVILVDGPLSFLDTLPGRMKSIALSPTLVKDSGHIFVHDCDREAERVYCDRYLGTENLVEQVGVLRHYRGSAGDEASTWPQHPAR